MFDHLITYAKIIHNTSDNVELDGPYIVGKNYSDLKLAELAAKQLVKETREELLIKIYELKFIDQNEVYSLAKDYFATVLKSMKASLELNNRPIRKRKKRGPATSIDRDLLDLDLL